MLLTTAQLGSSPHLYACSYLPSSLFFLSGVSSRLDSFEDTRSRFPSSLYHASHLTAMHIVVPRLHLGGLICCFLSVFCSEAFERVVLYCIYSGHERICFIFFHSSFNDKLNTDYTSVIGIQPRMILRHVHVIAMCVQTSGVHSPHGRFDPALLLKFPMNTTRTAQYAAVAAKSSARLALVRRPIAAENRSPKPIKSPMLRNVLARVPVHVTRYITNTGTANKRMMTIATNTTATPSIRATLKYAMYPSWKPSSSGL